MKFIGKDDDLFELIKDGVIRILDSEITRINIFEESVLIFEVDLTFKANLVRLRFKGIKEYSFYYNSTHIFYNVECYTLIKNDNLFYISFDPEDERSAIILENDNDFILCESIEVYSI